MQIKEGEVRTTQLLEYSNGIFQGQMFGNPMKKNGLGVFAFDNGDFYFGEWENDNIQGEGILFFAFGGFVHGFFEKSKLHGPAFLKFSNGEIYEGNWRNGYLEGEAFNYFIDENIWLKCTYQNGKFENLLEEGEGRAPSIILNHLSEMRAISQKHRTGENPRVKVIDFKDGQQFLGAAIKNKTCGLGILRKLDGKCDIGFCDDGRFVDIGRINLKDGALFDGLLKGGMFHGRGVYYNPHDKSWLFGHFENGECKQVSKQGKGKYPLQIVEQIRAQHHKKSNRYIDQIVAANIFNVPAGYNKNNKTKKDVQWQPQKIEQMREKTFSQKKSPKIIRSLYIHEQIYKDQEDLIQRQNHRKRSQEQMKTVSPNSRLYAHYLQKSNKNSEQDENIYKFKPSGVKKEIEKSPSFKNQMYPNQMYQRGRQSSPYKQQKTNAYQSPQKNGNNNFQQLSTPNLSTAQKKQGQLIGSSSTSTMKQPIQPLQSSKTLPDPNQNYINVQDSYDMNMDIDLPNQKEERSKQSKRNDKAELKDNQYDNKFNIAEQQQQQSIQNNNFRSPSFNQKGPEQKTLTEEEAQEYFQTIQKHLYSNQNTEVKKRSPDEKQFQNLQSGTQIEDYGSSQQLTSQYLNNQYPNREQRELRNYNNSVNIQGNKSQDMLNLPVTHFRKNTFGQEVLDVQDPRTYNQQIQPNQQILPNQQIQPNQQINQNYLSQQSQSKYQTLQEQPFHPEYQSHLNQQFQHQLQNDQLQRSSSSHATNSQFDNIYNNKLQTQSNNLSYNKRPLSQSYHVSASAVNDVDQIDTQNIRQIENDDRQIKSQISQQYPQSQSQISLESTKQGQYPYIGTKDDNSIQEEPLQKIVQQSIQSNNNESFLNRYQRALNNDDPSSSYKEYQEVVGGRNEIILNKMQYQKNVGSQGIQKRDELINFQTCIIGQQDQYISRHKRLSKSLNSQQSYTRESLNQQGIRDQQDPFLFTHRANLESQLNNNSYYQNNNSPSYIGSSMEASQRSGKHQRHSSQPNMSSINGRNISNQDFQQNAPLSGKSNQSHQTISIRQANNTSQNSLSNNTPIQNNQMYVDTLHTVRGQPTHNQFKEAQTQYQTSSHSLQNTVYSPIPNIDLIKEVNIPSSSVGISQTQNISLQNIERERQSQTPKKSILKEIDSPRKANSPKLVRFSQEIQRQQSNLPSNQSLQNSNYSQGQQKPQSSFSENNLIPLQQNTVPSIIQQNQQDQITKYQTHSHENLHPQLQIVNEMHSPSQQYNSPHIQIQTNNHLIRQAESFLTPSKMEIEQLDIKSQEYIHKLVAQRSQSPESQKILHKLSTLPVDQRQNFIHNQIARQAESFIQNDFENYTSSENTPYEIHNHRNNQNLQYLQSKGSDIYPNNNLISSFCNDSKPPIFPRETYSNRTSPKHKGEQHQIPNRSLSGENIGFANSYKKDNRDLNQNALPQQRGQQQINDQNKMMSITDQKGFLHINPQSPIKQNNPFSNESASYSHSNLNYSQSSEQNRLLTNEQQQNITSNNNSFGQSGNPNNQSNIPQQNFQPFSTGSRTQQNYQNQNIQNEKQNTSRNPIGHIFTDEVCEDLQDVNIANLSKREQEKQSKFTPTINEQVQQSITRDNIHSIQQNKFVDNEERYSQQLPQNSNNRNQNTSNISSQSQNMDKKSKQQNEELFRQGYQNTKDNYQLGQQQLQNQSLYTDPAYSSQGFDEQNNKLQRQGQNYGSLNPISNEQSSQQQQKIPQHLSSQNLKRRDNSQQNIDEQFDEQFNQEISSDNYNSKSNKYQQEKQQGRQNDYQNSPNQFIQDQDQQFSNSQSVNQLDSRNMQPQSPLKYDTKQKYQISQQGQIFDNNNLYSQSPYQQERQYQSQILNQTSDDQNDNHEQKYLQLQNQNEHEQIQRKLTPNKSYHIENNPNSSQQIGNQINQDGQYSYHKDLSIKDQISQNQHDIQNNRHENIIHPSQKQIQSSRHQSPQIYENQKDRHLTQEEELQLRAQQKQQQLHQQNQSGEIYQGDYTNEKSIRQSSPEKVNKSINNIFEIQPQNIIQGDVQSPQRGEVNKIYQDPLTKQLRSSDQISRDVIQKSRQQFMTPGQQSNYPQKNKQISYSPSNDPYNIKNQLQNEQYSQNSELQSSNKVFNQQELQGYDPNYSRDIHNLKYQDSPQKYNSQQQEQLLQNQHGQRIQGYQSDDNQELPQYLNDQRDNSVSQLNQNSSDNFKHQNMRGISPQQIARQSSEQPYGIKQNSQNQQVIYQQTSSPIKSNNQISQISQNQDTNQIYSQKQINEPISDYENFEIKRSNSKQNSNYQLQQSPLRSQPAQYGEVSSQQQLQYSGSPSKPIQQQFYNQQQFIEGEEIHDIDSKRNLSKQQIDLQSSNSQRQSPMKQNYEKQQSGYLDQSYRDSHQNYSPNQSLTQQRPNYIEQQQQNQYSYQENIQPQQQYQNKFNNSIPERVQDLNESGINQYQQNEALQTQQSRINVDDQQFKSPISQQKQIQHTEHSQSQYNFTQQSPIQQSFNPSLQKLHSPGYGQGESQNAINQIGTPKTTNQIKQTTTPQNQESQMIKNFINPQNQQINQQQEQYGSNYEERYQRSNQSNDNKNNSFQQISQPVISQSQQGQSIDHFKGTLQNEQLQNTQAQNQNHSKRQQDIYSQNDPHFKSVQYYEQSQSISKSPRNTSINKSYVDQQNNQIYSSQQELSDLRQPNQQIQSLSQTNKTQNSNQQNQFIQQQQSSNNINPNKYQAQLPNNSQHQISVGDSFYQNEQNMPYNQGLSNSNAQISDSNRQYNQQSPIRGERQQQILQDTYNDVRQLDRSQNPLQEEQQIFDQQSSPIKDQRIIKYSSQSLNKQSQQPYDNQISQSYSNLQNQKQPYSQVQQSPLYYNQQKMPTSENLQQEENLRDYNSNDPYYNQSQAYSQNSHHPFTLHSQIPIDQQSPQKQHIQDKQISPQQQYSNSLNSQRIQEEIFDQQFPQTQFIQQQQRQHSQKDLNSSNYSQPQISKQIEEGKIYQDPSRTQKSQFDKNDSPHKSSNLQRNNEQMIEISSGQQNNYLIENPNSQRKSYEDMSPVSHLSFQKKDQNLAKYLQQNDIQQQIQEIDNQVGSKYPQLHVERQMPHSVQTPYKRLNENPISEMISIDSQQIQSPHQLHNLSYSSPQRFIKSPIQVQDQLSNQQFDKSSPIKHHSQEKYSPQKLEQMYQQNQQTSPFSNKDTVYGSNINKQENLTTQANSKYKKDDYLTTNYQQSESKNLNKSLEQLQKSQQISPYSSQIIHSPYSQNEKLVQQQKQNIAQQLDPSIEGNASRYLPDKEYSNITIRNDVQPVPLQNSIKKHQEEFIKSPNQKKYMKIGSLQSPSQSPKRSPHLRSSLTPKHQSQMNQPLSFRTYQEQQQSTSSNIYSQFNKGQQSERSIQVSGDVYNPGLVANPFINLQSPIDLTTGLSKNLDLAKSQNPIGGSQQSLNTIKQRQGSSSHYAEGHQEAYNLPQTVLSNNNQSPMIKIPSSLPNQGSFSQSHSSNIYSTLRVNTPQNASPIGRGSKPGSEQKIGFEQYANMQRNQLDKQFSSSQIKPPLMNDHTSSPAQYGSRSPHYHQTLSPSESRYSKQIVQQNLQTLRQSSGNIGSNIPAQQQDQIKQNQIIQISPNQNANDSYQALNFSQSARKQNESNQQGVLPKQGFSSPVSTSRRQSLKSNEGHQVDSINKSLVNTFNNQSHFQQGSLSSEQNRFQTTYKDNYNIPNIGYKNSQDESKQIQLSQRRFSNPILQTEETPRPSMQNLPPYLQSPRYNSQSPNPQLLQKNKQLNSDGSLGSSRRYSQGNANQTNASQNQQVIPPYATEIDNLGMKNPNSHSNIQNSSQYQQSPRYSSQSTQQRIPNQIKQSSTDQPIGNVRRYSQCNMNQQNSTQIQAQLIPPYATDLDNIHKNIKKSPSQDNQQFSHHQSYILERNKNNFFQEQKYQGIGQQSSSQSEQVSQSNTYNLQNPKVSNMETKSRISPNASQVLNNTFKQNQGVNLDFLDSNQKNQFSQNLSFQPNFSPNISPQGNINQQRFPQSANLSSQTYDPFSQVSYEQQTDKHKDLNTQSKKNLIQQSYNSSSLSKKIENSERNQQQNMSLKNQGEYFSEQSQISNTNPNQYKQNLQQIQQQSDNHLSLKGQGLPKKENTEQNIQQINPQSQYYESISSKKNEVSHFNNQQEREYFEKNSHLQPTVMDKSKSPKNKEDFQSKNSYFRGKDDLYAPNINDQNYQYEEDTKKKTQPQIQSSKSQNKGFYIPQISEIQVDDTQNEKRAEQLSKQSQEEIFNNSHGKFGFPHILEREKQSFLNDGQNESSQKNQEKLPNQQISNQQRPQNSDQYQRYSSKQTDSARDKIQANTSVHQYLNENQQSEVFPSTYQQKNQINDNSNYPISGSIDRQKQNFALSGQESVLSSELEKQQNTRAQIIQQTGFTSEKSQKQQPESSQILNVTLGKPPSTQQLLTEREQFSYYSQPNSNRLNISPQQKQQSISQNFNNSYQGDFNQLDSNIFSKSIHSQQEDLQNKSLSRLYASAERKDFLPNSLKQNQSDFQIFSSEPINQAQQIKFPQIPQQNQPYISSQNFEQNTTNEIKHFSKNLGDEKIGEQQNDQKKQYPISFDREYQKLASNEQLSQQQMGSQRIPETNSRQSLEMKQKSFSPMKNNEVRFNEELFGTKNNQNYFPPQKDQTLINTNKDGNQRIQQIGENKNNQQGNNTSFNQTTSFVPQKSTDVKIKDIQKQQQQQFDLHSQYQSIDSVNQDNSNNDQKSAVFNNSSFENISEPTKKTGIKYNPQQNSSQNTQPSNQIYERLQIPQQSDQNDLTQKLLDQQDLELKSKMSKQGNQSFEKNVQKESIQSFEDKQSQQLNNNFSKLPKPVINSSQENRSASQGGAAYNISFENRSLIQQNPLDDSYRTISKAGTKDPQSSSIFNPQISNTKDSSSNQKIIGSNMSQQIYTQNNASNYQNIQSPSDYSKSSQNVIQDNKDNFLNKPNKNIQIFQKVAEFPSQQQNSSYLLTGSNDNLLNQQYKHAELNQIKQGALSVGDNKEKLSQYKEQGNEKQNYRNNSQIQQYVSPPPKSLQQQYHHGISAYNSLNNEDEVNYKTLVSNASVREQVYSGQKQYQSQKLGDVSQNQSLNDSMGKMNPNYNNTSFGKPQNNESFNQPNQIRDRIDNIKTIENKIKLLSQSIMSAVNESQQQIRPEQQYGNINDVNERQKYENYQFNSSDQDSNDKNKQSRNPNLQNKNNSNIQTSKNNRYNYNPDESSHLEDGRRSQNTSLVFQKNYASLEKSASQLPNVNLLSNVSPLRLPFEANYVSVHPKASNIVQSQVQIKQQYGGSSFIPANDTRSYSVPNQVNSLHSQIIQPSNMQQYQRYNAQIQQQPLAQSFVQSPMKLQQSVSASPYRQPVLMRNSTQQLQNSQQYIQGQIALPSYQQQIGQQPLIVQHINVPYNHNQKSSLSPIKSNSHSPSQQSFTPIRPVKKEIIYKTHSPQIIQDHQSRSASANRIATDVLNQSSQIYISQQGISPIRNVIYDSSVLRKSKTVQISQTIVSSNQGPFKNVLISPARDNSMYYSVALSKTSPNVNPLTQSIGFSPQVSKTPLEYIKFYTPQKVQFHQSCHKTNIKNINIKQKQVFRSQRLHTASPEIRGQGEIDRIHQKNKGKGFFSCCKNENTDEGEIQVDTSRQSLLTLQQIKQQQMQQNQGNDDNSNCNIF